MSEHKKPLPRMPRYELPYWEAARNRELRLQKCNNCGKLRYPPNPICPDCLSSEHEWIRLSGKGHVFSWIVYHQAFHLGFADSIPYNVAWVELEEGPRLTTNIVDMPNEDLYIGMPVEAVFEDVSEEVTLAKFKARSRSE